MEVSTNNKNNVLISVVVPLYNSEKYIKKTIQSVIRQTYNNWELFIIDDCSIDNSKEIVKKLVESDNRIQLIELDINSGGPAKPRNIGISLSHGEYVAFLDSDDIWYSNKLSQIVQYLIYDDKIDVVCHDERLKIMGESTNIVLHHGPYDKDFYKTMLIGGNRLSTSATCVRTSFLMDNNLYFSELSNYVIVEDYDLWLRLANQDAVFKFIENPLGEYAIQNKSISLNTGRARNNLEVLLRNHVYHTQIFTKNKDVLWSIVSFRLLVSDVKNKYKEMFLLIELSRYFILVVNHPIGAAFYIKSFIKRRLRNYFLDFKTKRV